MRYGFQGSHWGGGTPRLMGFMFLILILALSALLGLASSVGASQDGPVVVVNFNVGVDPGSAAMMSRAVSTAVSQDASAILIVMNTPGGLLESMISIVNSIANANQSGIPTYTWVPPNDLAASAGSYIAMATNKILMGHGSEIGPSTPIVEGGTPLEQNHTEAAMISLMVSLAQKWHRNTTAAYLMVYADQAYSAQQAYAVGISNGFAENMSQALNELGLAGKPLVYVNQNLYEQLVSALSNSVVDGILILLGELAVVLDLYHPTIVLTVVGIIAILLGLVGLGVIAPTALGSTLGIILLIVGGALIILEIKLGHGFAAMGGVATGALGILFLTLGVPSSPSLINTTTEVELLALVGAGVLGGVYIRTVIRPIRTKKKLTGPEAIIGKQGVAVSALNPDGEVRVEGVIWRARSSDRIEPGERVVVKAREGLTLVVEKAK
ncbi:MAG: nodulation protein NfeD [Thermoprotei archaeon]